MSIPALSLTVPWPWAVLECGKGGTGSELGIENRQSWSSCAYRGPLLIHASNPEPLVMSWWKRVHGNPTATPTGRQEEAAHELRDLVRDIHEIAERNGTAPPAEPVVSLNRLLSMAGHIVGITEVVGVVDAVMGVPTAYLDRHGPSRTRPLTKHEARWWMGGFALALSNTRALTTPVRVPGCLGLWKPPSAVLDACRAALPADYTGWPT